MNTTDVELLMNRYFDNDLSDAEEGILFLHLGSSKESRTLFADLKVVHEALQHPAAVTYPASLEQKLGVLNVGQIIPSTMQKSITFSMPSAILSGLLIAMMSLLLFLTVSPKQQSITEHPVDEQAMMMFQSIPSDHLQR